MPEARSRATPLSFTASSAPPKRATIPPARRRATPLPATGWRKSIAMTARFRRISLRIRASSTSPTRSSTTRRLFEKPEGNAPKTLVELTGRAVSASRQGLRNARSALRLIAIDRPAADRRAPAPQSVAGAARRREHPGWKPGRTAAGQSSARQHRRRRFRPQELPLRPVVLPQLQRRVGRRRDGPLALAGAPALRRASPEPSSRRNGHGRD